jgi:hypothetical protein
VGAAQNAYMQIGCTVRVKIPLAAADEGELSAFSESLTPPTNHDERGVTGSRTIVDVYLAARVEPSADVEGTCSLWEGSFDDVNWAHAAGTYQFVSWSQRPAPTTVTPGAAGLDGTSVSEGPAYRWGGRTAMNLTPRPGQDTSGPKPGLSMSTTPKRGWTFSSGTAQLRNLGFELDPDSTDADPGHFVLRPGLGHVARGWTLDNWAATRLGINESDPSTWHDLTRILHDAAS